MPSLSVLEGPRPLDRLITDLEADVPRVRASSVLERIVGGAR